MSGIRNIGAGGPWRRGRISLSILLLADLKIGAMDVSVFLSEYAWFFLSRAVGPRILLQCIVHMKSGRTCVVTWPRRWHQAVVNLRAGQPEESPVLSDTFNGRLARRCSAGRIGDA